MARTKTNKSALIKETLQANPDMGPKEIAALVTKAGAKCTPMYVSNIKASMNKGKGKGKRGRKAKVGNGSPSFTAVESTIVFVKGVGGIEQAKQLIALLEK